MITLKHIGYWCDKPSEVFPERRDHRKCRQAPPKGQIKFGDRFICLCPCHKKGRAKKAGGKAKA